MYIENFEARKFLKLFQHFNFYEQLSVIKLLHAQQSTLLSTKFILLINVKML